MRLTRRARRRVFGGRDGGPRRAPPRARLRAQPEGLAEVENPDSRLFRAFFVPAVTSKRGEFEPSITQTFYSPPLRSCVAWVLHTTKLPAIAKAFTALDSGEPHVSGRWRSLALPVRRARRAVPFAETSLKKNALLDGYSLPSSSPRWRTRHAWHWHGV